jgi:hypothetical protein
MDGLYPPRRDSPGSALLSWQKKQGNCPAKGTNFLSLKIEASSSKSAPVSGNHLAVLFLQAHIPCESHPVYKRSDQHRFDPRIS